MQMQMQKEGELGVWESGSLGVWESGSLGVWESGTPSPGGGAAAVKDLLSVLPPLGTAKPKPVLVALHRIASAARLCRLFPGKKTGARAPKKSKSLRELGTPAEMCQYSSNHPARPGTHSARWGLAPFPKA
jgi:hypothetical protein